MKAIEIGERLADHSGNEVIIEYVHHRFQRVSGDQVWKANLPPHPMVPSLAVSFVNTMGRPAAALPTVPRDVRNSPLKGRVNEKISTFSIVGILAPWLAGLPESRALPAPLSKY